MIIFFADREMRPLGHATTNLPNGYVIKEDLKTEEVETGVATFSCVIGFNAKNRKALEAMTNAGNYLMRSNGDENEFYTIIDAEIDSKNKEIYVYAEDAGLDLINEIVGEFEAPETHTADWYVNKYIVDSGFEIGINEIPASTTRKLSWEGEETVTARLASIATQFGGFEVSYSYAIKGLEITNKYVNIFAKRGKDEGVQLRLNRELDKIVTTKSVANLATAFVCEGGVPDGAEEPITLKGYKVEGDDAEDFFIDENGTLKAKTANKKWSRYVWNKEPNKLNDGEGYIVRPYSYNTPDQKTLCSHAITELKKVCDMEINFEVDIKRLPESVKIGDRVYVVDDEGELYVSSRILVLETSVTEQTHKATLGEHLIKKSGISQKVADLAAAFSKASTSALRAMDIASNAKENANAAKDLADAAANEADEALKKAQEALDSANNSLTVSNGAQSVADKAQAAVDKVEDSVAALDKTIQDAQAAIDNAHNAAEIATSKAEEALTAAGNAQEYAEAATLAAAEAKASLETTLEKANEAVDAADEAKTNAQAALETAAAAKADAEQAERDVEEWAGNLETFKKSVSENYVRQTELTETTSALQAQITANANELSITHSQLTVIDETANDAKEKADLASEAADAAKLLADAATLDADRAQRAATTAREAAEAAQAEADTAQAAADTARSVANKADEDLEAAKADLATVQGRVDATEEEIAAAQKAVDDAQLAADAARAEAEIAVQKAADAQATADKAAENAVIVQQKANEAASQAALTQAVINGIIGDAEAAQAKADEAAAIAAAAQETANEAVANAATAQDKADQAAQEAADALEIADNAKTAADQAQADLNTAQQNLADVTSRVDATEAEIAAAEAAVELAQTKADEAQSAADTAQSAADTAKAQADQAIEDAATAQATAENAQRAAEEAKDAADKAQIAANSLAVRVTNAETEIQKTNDSIKLLASKEELASTMAGFYTKTETDSKIDQKADSITLSVSETIDNIKVGTRNWAIGTSEKWTDFETGGDVGSLILSYATPNSENSGVHHYSDLGVVVDDYVTIGIDVTANNATMYLFVGCYDSAALDGTMWSYTSNMISKGSSGRCTVQIPIKAYSPYICASLRQYGSTKAVVAEQYKCLQVVHGIKPADWAPAPEDVQGNIDEVAADAADQNDKTVERVSKAESIIQQLKDAINLLVTDENGTTLLQQTSEGWSFNLKSVQDNVDSATEQLGALTEDVGSTQAAVEVLNKAVEDLGRVGEYIKISTYTYTDDEGNEQTEPSIDLGEQDTGFKLKITNTRIWFTDGANDLVSINSKNKTLEIGNATVKGELHIGDEGAEQATGVWVWKQRSNGNLGLTWKGVNS